MSSWALAEEWDIGTFVTVYMRMRRFLWVMQYLVGAGFYVIPAYMPADSSADNVVAANPEVFTRNWANLWTAITEVPTFNSTLRGEPRPEHERRRRKT